MAMPNEPLTLEDFENIAAVAKARVERVRGMAAAPEERKTAPRFSVSQLAELSGLDVQQIHYRISKGKIPQGEVGDRGRRSFSLAEAQECVRLTRTNRPLRGTGKCSVIAVVNFKGGSTKTTTAMTIAQGLSLQGHERGLVIDLDPQGTLTQFFGLLPDSEVPISNTVAGICYDQETPLSDAIIKNTYWHGLDLIAASPELFGAEFVLPSMQVRNPGFRFWEVLSKAIEPLRDEYDFVVIDTSPSLSYLTINALFAADGLIVPTPPDNPSYSSLAQFWNLFADIAGTIQSRNQVAKTFDFLHVLPSRVDMTQQSMMVVKGWLSATYPDYILPIDIPETAVAGTASLQYQTVYDIEKYTGSAKTYTRARDAYDQLVSIVEESIAKTWKRTATAELSK